MLAPLFIGVKGKLLDLGATNGGMQVVMQAGTLGLAEEHPGELLKFRGTQCLETTGKLVTPIEQAVDVLLDEALALADGRRVAEQEHHTRTRLDLAIGHAMQQPLEQFDRRCFIAMDTSRQQQVQPAIVAFGRTHLKCALPQPAQTHALGCNLGLLGRFVIGQGQLKQFSEGEHRHFLSGGGRNQGHGRDRRLQRLQPVPSPAAG
ncbi:hypothetical protein D3C81_1213810 [compost metagenome]